MGWVRSTTDVAASMVAILKGDTSVRDYLRSLRNCNTDAVFSASDPAPGLAEVALLPYLAVKRGF
jgi:predicted ATP-grasp superfamily ATP-dependent carboligase